MSYYLEPQSYSHNRGKGKVVLDLSSYATKNKLDHATGVDTSGLAAKKVFITFKVEIGKLDLNELVYVPTSFNNFKTKVGDLDVKLKTIPVDLKKISDAVENEVVKNTKFKTLKIKVNNLKKKILDATTLIHIKSREKNRRC